MRPRGEIRLAIASVAREFGEAGATWRDIYARAPFTPGLVPSVARTTVDNMARAGELAVLGAVRVPGVCRPMLRYAAVVIGEPAAPPGAALDAVCRRWADFS